MDEIICSCYNVWRSQIEKAVDIHDCKTVDDLRNVMDISKNCQSCEMFIEMIIDEVNGD